jgi:hypothetical protein
MVTGTAKSTVKIIPYRRRYFLEKAIALSRMLEKNVVAAHAIPMMAPGMSPDMRY